MGETYTQSVESVNGMTLCGHDVEHGRSGRGSRLIPSALRSSVFRAGVIGLLFSLSALGLSGCRSSWPFDSPAVLLNNVQFLDTWKTYLHCRASLEPEEIRADFHQLSHVARSIARRNRSPLPAAIRSLISPLPSRLSVDPQAMTVACALHGSHVAQAAGQPEVGIELLTAVVTTQKGMASVYYAVETDHQLGPLE